MDERILLGHVGVDSGQLMIIDPFYVDSHQWHSQGRHTYNQICRITASPQHGGALPYDLGHEGLAVAFQSGCGAGVYATVGEVPGGDRRIKRVEVVLIEDAP